MEKHHGKREIEFIQGTAQIVNDQLNEEVIYIVFNTLLLHHQFRAIKASRYHVFKF